MNIKIETVNTSETYIAENQLLDSQETRMNPSVPGIACHKIPDIAILDQKSPLIDLDIVRTHFLNEGKLSTRQIYKILGDADAILRKEPNLVKIDRPCYVFGDTHGQFYDLVSVLQTMQFPHDTIIFLGDYVDRGCFSTEVYLYLMLLKTHYPDNIILLRGNHESLKMTTYFTFKNECIKKYNSKIYERFVESFMCLPMAAIIQNKAYCAHGGISPELQNIDQINQYDRFQEIQYEGLFSDILWSDPDRESFTSGFGWRTNYKRNCSYMYNFGNVKKFLDANGLVTILRAHEVQEHGYELFEKHNDHPSVVTIFSAPNYCDAYKNKGAFIEFNNKITAIHQFNWVNHPYVLRGFIDGINWSFPFVLESLFSLITDILDFVNELDSGEEDSSGTKKEIANQDEVTVQTIINAIEEPIEKMKVPVAIMRAERENIDEFEDEDSAADCCALNDKEVETDNFEDAQNIDAINEVKKDCEVVNPITINVSPSMQESLSNCISEIDINNKIDEKFEAILDDRIEHDCINNHENNCTNNCENDCINDQTHNDNDKPSNVFTEKTVIHEEKKSKKKSWFRKICPC